jgi:hypothetical protein
MPWAAFEVEIGYLLSNVALATRPITAKPIGASGEVRRLAFPAGGSRHC